MKYRLLGKSKLKVSEIGFGCMSLAKNSGTESRQLLRRAVDMGVNFFDTADLYERGHNEEVVGAALRPVRDKIIIATKVGNEWLPGGDTRRWNPRKAYILKAADESLRRLQTDYIDLYQLHGGTIDDPIEETIEAFELLKKEGKILHYGISSIRPNVIREYIKRSGITSVMLQYSLLDRRPEESVLNSLKEHNIGVLVRGALAQGLLIDKPAKEYLQYDGKTVEKIQQTIKGIINNVDLVGAVAGYVLANPAVTSIVAGFSTQGQIEALLRADFKPDNPLTASLAAAVPVNQYGEHR